MYSITWSPVTIGFSVATLSAFLLWIGGKRLKITIPEKPYTDFLQDVRMRRIGYVSASEGIGFFRVYPQIEFGSAYEVVNPYSTQTLMQLLSRLGIVVKPLHNPFQGSLRIWLSFLAALCSTAAMVLIYPLTLELIGLNTDASLNKFFKTEAQIWQTFLPSENQVETPLSFENVLGYEEEKQELIELVEWFKDPAKLLAVNASMPKGILLEGPPGTGKTLLAKAFAREAKVPFLYVSGASFVETVLGLGATRVRALFEEARKLKKCVVFIDEFDALGGNRGGPWGHSERDHTLNQLLTEIDGFKGQHGVLIIAATNQIGLLDPAILRPGRFDRKVRLDLPDAAARLAIVQWYAKKLPFDSKIDWKSWDDRFQGKSGAELSNLINDAGLIAFNLNHATISQADVMEAYLQYAMGIMKDYWTDDEGGQKTRLLTAYHEGGHALITILMGLKSRGLTISPRGPALGFASLSLEDGSRDFTASELTSLVVMSYGGRAAEVLVDGPIAGFSAGAGGAPNSDLGQATDRLISLFAMFQPYEGSKLFISTNLNDLAEATRCRYLKALEKASIDKFQKALKTLSENWHTLEAMKEALLVKEHLEPEELYALIRRESSLSQKTTMLQATTDTSLDTSATSSDEENFNDKKTKV